MLQYLISSIALALFGTVLYNASHSALRDGVRTAIGLLLSLFMVAPLALACANAPHIQFPTADFTDNGLYAETLEEAYCSGIAAALAERYALPSESFEVSAVGLDTESMRSQSVRVVLCDKARRLDYNAVETFVLNSVDTGGCVVEYKID